MMHYVYILQSEIDGTYYKGYTANIPKRLEEHNLSKSYYTSRKIPWKLVYFEEFSTKTEALIREKQIKRYNSIYLRRLIDDFNNKG